jgi:hypothetical protein
MSNAQIVSVLSVVAGVILFVIFGRAVRNSQPDGKPI